MILSDKLILEAIERKEIVIEPFDRSALGSNSYDVHLGRVLKTYELEGQASQPTEAPFAVSGIGVSLLTKFLDCSVKPHTRSWNIDSRGIVLMPGHVYLGVTEEYTETHKHVPFLDGKSSIGRLGISIHCTAGRGDVGFCNHWTLEIYVQQPVRVYAGMPIGQLIYFKTGPIDVPYNKKSGAKYTERCMEPQESKMYRNFSRK